MSVASTGLSTAVTNTPPAPLAPTGVYTFGLFTVDIFVNAGQVVTGNLAPYFLTVCKPNYTALGCQQSLRYISHQEACTGNQDDVLRARKTFPSKEAALSVYAALYLAVSCPPRRRPRPRCVALCAAVKRCCASVL